MVLPITFVKASGNGRASFQKFTAIATTTTICFDMDRHSKGNVGSLPTGKCSAPESKAVIRLIVSLLRNPVLNMGGIVAPLGSCKRFLNGGDVHYAVLSTCKGSVFRYTVSLSKLVRKYGINVGNLRSRIRISLMRSSKYRESRGSILVKGFTDTPMAKSARATRAAMSHEVSGLTTVPVNFKLPGGVSLLRSPKYVIHRSLFTEGLINPFMLFKFFYPEVFRYIGWYCNDTDLPLWAALGYLLRRGTPLEIESENRFRVKYWNKVNSFATSFDEVLTEVRRISALHVPHRLVPFSEENPVGSVRYGGWLCAAR
jgi:hypothetical protein